MASFKCEVGKMFWYEGKKVTLDLVVGLTISVIALGTIDNARTQNVANENHSLQTVNEQVVSLRNK
ncbi:MAG: hypothetical protein Kow0049_08050 [Stanieria sp.]